MSRSYVTHLGVGRTQQGTQTALAFTFDSEIGRQYFSERGSSNIFFPEDFLDSGLGLEFAIRMADIRHDVTDGIGKLSKSYN